MTPLLKQRVRDLSSMIADGMQSFDPPVSAGAIRDFEGRNGVELPEDYRWFITQVASGGPGPANGLIPFRLGLTDARLAEPWIDPLRWNETDGEYDDDDEGGVYQGVLAVGDLGCGSIVQLVLVGPHRGEVWYDLSAGSEGYRLAGASFCEWYGAWVDAQPARITEGRRAKEARLQACEDAVAAAPASEDALCRALYGFGGARNTERFAHYLERAIEVGQLSPSSAPTIIDDALTLSLSEAAERLLDRRLKDADSGETTFRCLRALVRMQRGQTDAALDDWSKAQASADFEPPQRCAVRIAFPLLAAGDVERALGVYIDGDDVVIGPASEVADEALARGEPALAVGWCEALLDRLRALQRTQESVDEEDDEDEIAELFADTHSALVVPLLLGGRAADAEEHARLAEELGARLDWSRIALAACESRAFEAGLRYLARCAMPAWWIANLRGCCLEGLDRLEEALVSFEESLETRNWIVPFENRAYTQIRLGHFDAARQLLDEVERFAPEFKWTHYHRAALHAREGDVAKAEASLQRALSLGLDPALPRTEPYLAEMLVNP